MFNSSLFPPAAPKAAGQSAQGAKGCNDGCGIACMLCSCVSPSEKICSGHKICSAILSGLKRVWSFSLLLIAGAAANVALVINFYCRYSGVSNENVPAHANVCGDHVVYHHPARRVQAQPNILHAQCAGSSQARMSSVPSSHKTVPIGVLIYWASLCDRDAYVKREPVL